MAENEKIKGGAIAKLFKELLHYQTLLKLTLVDGEYENLALVTDLVRRNNEPHFIIDSPEGLKQAAAAIDSWKLHFEFTAKDHIKYSFAATDPQIDDNRIYIKYPPEITRWQRRGLFRIDAPAGTKLCLTQDTVRYELEVINISIGGTLAALVETRSRHFEKAPFADKQFLKNIELLFPPQIMPTPIRIKAIQIKRMIMNSEKADYEVGFAFHEMDTDEEKRLTDLIYRLHRQHLRKRLPLDLEGDEKIQN
jgi:c-di-GMP-binding flagellar brake protein YcgR